MAGVAGAKNTYSAGTHIGNWVEDIWGSRHAARMQGPTPVLGASEHRSRYEAPPPGAAGATSAASRPIDSLDGHLMLAHGTNIVDRTPSANHFLTVTQAQFKGATGDAALGGTVPAASRTELLREKAKMQAAGIDAWDPPSLHRSSAPAVGSTIAPTVALPTAGAGLVVSAEAAVASGAFAVARGRASAAGGGGSGSRAGGSSSVGATARLSSTSASSSSAEHRPGMGNTRSSSPGAGVLYPSAGRSGAVSVSGVALHSSAVLSQIAPPREVNHGRSGSFTSSFGRGPG